MYNKDKLTILDSASHGGATFEICALNNLEGATNPEMAMQLYFAKQQGLQIRFVRIHLNDAKIKTEAGALYYYNGNIRSETKFGGVGGLLKKTISGKLTKESAIKPEYAGVGDVYLEPSFKHYFILPLNNDSIIVDKSMFYCCSDSISVTPVAQQSFSSVALGNEGLFQVKLSGSGIVVLESNVPQSEVQQIRLQPGEELKVDGNFALLRSENIKFTVTTSDKSLINSAINGEGFLNTFKAIDSPGFVWIAPTAPIYKKLNFGMPITNKGRNNQE